MSEHVDSFAVIAEDDHGAPVRCSGCPRAVTRVVVLPFTYRPELKDRLHRLRVSDGEELWMGLCAYCLLAMAKALSQAEAEAQAKVLARAEGKV